MNIEQILEAIENMKVLELNELVKAAEEKFGVSAAAPVMVAGGAAAGGAAVEEKSEFDVILADAGSSKVGVIKAVREITGSAVSSTLAWAMTWRSSSSAVR